MKAHSGEFNLNSPKIMSTQPPAIANKFAYFVENEKILSKKPHSIFMRANSLNRPLALSLVRIKESSPQKTILPVQESLE